MRKITANTSTQLCCKLPLVLDEASVRIMEAPAWDNNADSVAIENADPSHAATLNIPTANFVGQELVMAGFTVHGYTSSAHLSGSRQDSRSA